MSKVTFITDIVVGENGPSQLQTDGFNRWIRLYQKAFCHFQFGTTKTGAFINDKSYGFTQKMNQMIDIEGALAPGDEKELEPGYYMIANVNFAEKLFGYLPKPFTIHTYEQDKFFLVLPSTEQMIFAMDRVAGKGHSKKHDKLLKKAISSITQFLYDADRAPLEKTTTITRIVWTLDDLKSLVTETLYEGFCSWDVETRAVQLGLTGKEYKDHSTSPSLALPETLGISYRVGEGHVIPLYHPQSWFNIGQWDELKFIAIDEECEEIELTDYHHNTAWLETNSFYKIKVVENGQPRRFYNGNIAYLTTDQAKHLYNNWQHCKEQGIDNYILHYISPELDVLSSSTELWHVIANASFDLCVLMERFLQLEFPIYEGMRLLDPITFQRVIDNTKPAGIKPQTYENWIDLYGYGDDIDFGNTDFGELAIYNAHDTDIELRLGIMGIYKLMDMEDKSLFRYYMNEAISRHYFLTDLSFEGLTIDLDVLKENSAIVTATHAELEAKVRDHPNIKKYEVHRRKAERNNALKVLEDKCDKKIEETCLRWRSKIEQAEENGTHLTTKGAVRKPHLDLKAKLLRAEAREFTSGYPIAQVLKWRERMQQIRAGEAVKVDLLQKDGTLRNREIFTGLNLGSPDQLKDFLFHHPQGLQMEPVGYTESGQPSTDKYSMRRMEDGTGFFLMLSELSGLAGLMQNFHSIESRLCPRGHIHTQFGTTNTRRLSSRNPNLQNLIQRSEFESVSMGIKLFKSCIVPPKQFILASADLSQAELRYFAHVFCIENMLDAYDKGVDLHVRTGATVAGVTEEEFLSWKETDPKKFKKQRTAAKIANFGSIYFGGPSVIQTSAYKSFAIDYTIDQATAIQQAFFDTYPDIRPNVKKFIKKCMKKGGYAESLFGSRRYDRKIYSNDDGTFQAALRALVNKIIQGSVGIHTTLAGQVLTHYLRALGLKSRIVNTVHDSLILHIHEDEIDIIPGLAFEAMNYPLTEEYFGFTMPLMKSDIEVGENYASLEDITEIENWEYPALEGKELVNRIVSNHGVFKNTGELQLG